MNRRLYRSRTDSVIGGVAGGVAEYLDVDPSIVRIVWAILAIVTSGIFLVLYIVMWIVVPEGPARQPAGPMPPPAAEEEGTGTQVASVADTSAWTPAAEEPRRHRSSNVAPMVFGLLLIGLGAWFLLDEYIPWLDRDLLWPIGLVAIGVVLLVVSARRGTPTAE
ncbi:MAG TPA: PspC domain-containing protein [candidate division Zixibacteria bacterium]|nr:PspC domain-containing protein [candidate division Zixibacteria bacterium]